METMECYVYDQKLGPSEINRQCEINCLHSLGYQWMSTRLLVGGPVKLSNISGKGRKLRTVFFLQLNLLADIMTKY